MDLKSIKKKNLYEEIVYQIIQFTQNENLKPGDKLPPENKLMDLFDVSKTSVREALNILATRGIIEKRPGVGSILKEVTGSVFVENIANRLIMGEQALREILEFRRVIEVEAAGLAAERATKEQINKLREAHLNLIKANENGGIGIEEDYLFHYIIIISSGNSIFSSIFDTISTRFFEAIKITKNQSVMLSQQYITDTHKEHQKILEAIEAKDAYAARSEMLEHLQKNEQKLWSNELKFS
ncbi:FadR family transcriptional regulator [Peribacillus saganii]|uniref:FadR family transcriptional regulator n=1 Tax=Peribacillus saganii TaxID=2303992 RepID=A0A372LRA7_9BACI|nr:FadR/GntR family transcriptional regulator [Peribacillus saganii]RFU70302.1 FadR family transcriptional regulator [Peribacillus saganii]